MKYEAVLFDLFGTLIGQSTIAEQDETIKRMASTLSIHPDTFAALWHAEYDKRQIGAYPSIEDCMEHICLQAGVHVSRSQVESASKTIVEIENNYVLLPRKESINVLSFLRSNGYKTGLLSNCSMFIQGIWDRSPLAELLDSTVFSYAVGLKKPDQRIFELALNRLDVKPENCIYVADGMDGELAAASGLGIQACMIQYPGEVDYDLYREKWSGPTISSLKEVLTLLE